MANKMERFTQRARRVLSLAQEEAERLQHNYIGTEHLLLGLMREEGGVAGRVLCDLGAEHRRVEELVERMTRATPPFGKSGLDYLQVLSAFWNWRWMKHGGWDTTTSVRNICCWDWCASRKASPLMY
jgi:ATP-dependent Clp protease ATP-binding subunit ClpA